MAFLADSEYFNQKGKAFKVENNQWVSLKAKRISLHIIPELGPCMIIQQKDRSKIIQYQLQSKIKTKANPKNKKDNHGLLFKASRLRDNLPDPENIYAVKFGLPKEDEDFMESFLYLFKEWESITSSKLSDDWACHVCTLVNKANLLKCEICDCPRHRSRKSSETDAWICSSCSFKNLSMGNVCSMCNRKTGWACPLCTFLNKDESSKCEICGKLRNSESKEESVPRIQKDLQGLADYIVKNNPDPTILFKTLETICKQLKGRQEFGRTLWTKSEPVQRRLISFDGALEFLNLLGYRLDEKHLSLKCPIDEPPDLTLKCAKKVIAKTLENLKSIKSSIFLDENSERKYEEPVDNIEYESSRPVLVSIATVRIQNNLTDQVRPDDVNEWFNKDVVEESDTIWNILDKGHNTEDWKVLLLVHRTFTSSETLLRVLKKRWFDKTDVKERTDILQFCIWWTRLYFEDVKFQPSFAQKFKRFIQTAMQAEEVQTSKLATKLMAELEEAYVEEKHSEETQLRSSIEINKDHTVLDFESMDIAEVVTMLDYEKFKQIRHRELLNQAWKKKDRQERAPSVLAMIAQFNIMCKWTQICILSATGLLERQKTLSWFINLTSDLITIQNYNASWAVFSALTSTNIYYLKPAWAGVKEDRTEHKRLFNASGNYKVLRELLKRIEPPAIPHLGVLLKDLVFIDDGFVLLGDNSGDKVNFKKCTKLANRIHEGFGRFQEKPFKFNQDESLFKWLNYNQKKVEQIKDSFLELLTNQVKASDENEKSKRVFVNFLKNIHLKDNVV